MNFLTDSELFSNHNLSLKKLMSYLYSRLFIMILLCIYIFLFDYFYINWLSETFDYIGYEYNHQSTRTWFISHLFALLPLLWLRVSLERPSNLIYWLLFLLVYLPGQILPYFMGSSKVEELLPLSIFLFMGMAIIGISQYTPSIKIDTMTLKGNPNKIILILSSILILYVISVFGGSMKFVALSEIYQLREEADYLVQDNVLIGYVTMALSLCLLPFLIAYGIFRKNTFYFIFGFIGQIILFSTGGSKTNLFSTVIIIGIYYLIRNQKKLFGYKLIGSFATIILLLIIFNEVFDSSDQSSVLFVASSIIFMRTFTVGGLVMDQYFYFFESHPYTNYSHIGIVSKFIEYPYGQEPLGRVLGYFYSGDDLYNMNATFWLTDGIAAYGLPGILIISVICLGVFIVMDGCTIKHDVGFVSLSLLIIFLGMLNVSLFTTLFSGGLGFMIIFLNIVPPVISGPAKNLKN